MINNNIVRMEEVLNEKEQEIKKNYKPDPKLLECSICSQIFNRPTTLRCGHSFCHQCLISSISKKIQENKENRTITMIPLCPTCQSIIWRPLGTLKENVILSTLISKYSLQTKQNCPNITLPPHCEAQFHILIECARNSNTLLPHCFTQIVFATAFIDEILEQQSQSNLVVIRWPGAKENVGIAGRIFRPETYHYLMKATRYETVYKATFQGKYFVNLLDWQELDLKVNSSSHYSQSQDQTSPLMLCQVEQRKAANPITMDQLRIFFQTYDKLNNPVYLRQIAQLVDEKILHERNSPQKIIYCAMRLLKLTDKQVSNLANKMDDQERWMQIEQFLIKNAHKQVKEIIKIDIPGNYPHALVFALLFLVIIFQYMAK